MAAPPCTHPQTAQYFDRVRGQTSCTLCGEVLSDQQFELDPAFARGERGGGGGGGGARPGFSRPSRPSHAHGSHGLHRPSVESARRQLTAIARKLSITPAQVDLAAGVFKMAVLENAVIGARSAVLCACLYIVCRRQQHATPLTVLDFADVTGDSPFTIVSYMRTICKATSTTLPPVDPVFLVVRLVNHLDLGAESENIAIYAMKVMRAMREDWIATGRRPLGVAAAAVVVACNVHGVDVSLETLAAIVRLHHFTIVTRIEEFAATPAANLTCIDDYDKEAAGTTTAPQAFLKGRQVEENTALVDGMRHVANVFYELVNEAKAHAEATPERCEKWREFIKAKAESSGTPIEQLPQDLTKLSHREQLHIMGVVPRQAKTEQESQADAQPQTAPAAAAVDVASGVEAARTLIKNDPNAAQIQSLAESAPQAAAAASAAGPSPTAQTSGHGSATSPALDGVMPGEEELVLSDGSDIEDEYIIYDNEARLRAARANEEAFKDAWDKVGARVAQALKKATGLDELDGRSTTSTKRSRAPVAENALESLRRTLRNRGGGNVNVNALEQLLPGISSTSGFDDFGGDDFDLGGIGDDAAAAPASGQEFADDWLVE